MLELDSNEYAKVSALVDKVPFNNLFAKVVLERRVSGRVLVDDAVSPSVCLVVHRYGMALLCGNHQNDSFNGSLRSFLTNDSLNNGSVKWVLCYPEAWENALAILLGEALTEGPVQEGLDGRGESRTRHVLKTQRVNFSFNAPPPPSRLDLPAGFALRRIDSSIYDRITGTVVPRSFWDSAEDFLKNGIGFSLLANDQVVSTTFSSFIVGDRLELGVETHPSYRNRGLAVYAAAELIAYCLTKGFEPVWACSKDNVASFKLALTLGFSPSTYHPYYVIPTS